MEMYIDKANLISLYENRNDSLYSDAVKTMKNQLDVHYNFSKAESRKDEILSHLMTMFSTGISEAVQHHFSESIYPERSLKSNLHTTHPNKNTVFLLEDEKIDNCREKGGLLVHGKGEELILFKKLFLQENDYLFIKSLGIGRSDFRCWSDLKRYSLPLTDLVVIDRFILKDRVIASTIKLA